MTTLPGKSMCRFRQPPLRVSILSYFRSSPRHILFSIHHFVTPKFLWNACFLFFPKVHCYSLDCVGREQSAGGEKRGRGPSTKLMYLLVHWSIFILVRRYAVQGQRARPRYNRARRAEHLPRSSADHICRVFLFPNPPFFFFAKPMPKLCLLFALRFPPFYVHEVLGKMQQFFSSKMHIFLIPSYIRAYMYVLYKYACIYEHTLYSCVEIWNDVPVHTCKRINWNVHFVRKRLNPDVFVVHALDEVWVPNVDFISFILAIIFEFPRSLVFS